MKKNIFLVICIFFLMSVKVNAQGDIYWPTDTVYKYKGGFSLYSGHNGMDISAPSGSVLYAPFDGTVTFYQRYRVIGNTKVLVSYGNYAEVISEDGDTKVCICHMTSFSGAEFEPGHFVNAADYWPSHDSTLSAASWKAGDTEAKCGTIPVNEGDIIGYSGSTGRSTGPHLHVTLYVNGNFSSCVDPYPYFNDTMSAREHASRVSIQGGDMTIFVGEAEGYAAEVTGSKYSASDIRWDSSDPSVAKVDANGAVKGVKEGTADITAYLVDSSGKKVSGSEDSRTVKVKKPSIKLNETSVTLSMNSSVTLEAEVEGPDSVVTWTCSDSLFQHKTTGSSLTIKCPFLMTDKTVTITASSNGVSASCKIKLSRQKLSISSKNVSLYAGQSKKLKILPAAKGMKVSWKSSKSSVARVSSDGTVTARKPGKATISGKVDNQSFSCTVTVKKPRILLSVKKKTITVGDRCVIKAVVKGKSSKIKWSSGKKSVASVSQDGKVTARKAGVATITARANGVKATCQIIVKKKTYRSIYRAFLEKGYFTDNSNGRSYNVSMKSYYVLDINRDGMPELIVKSTEPYLSGPMDMHYVFTIRNGKVVSQGSYFVRGQSDIYYSKKYKAVYNSGWTNHVGGVWSHLFRMSGSSMKQFKYIWEGADSIGPSANHVYYIGDSDTSAKKVSKSKYIAFANKYLNFKKLARYKFVANNEANRKKSFKE